MYLPAGLLEEIQILYSDYIRKIEQDLRTLTIKPKENGMNLTTAIFMVDEKVRAVKVSYEDKENATLYTYKTIDPTISPGDHVVVPTTTRHKMTVCKVIEVDAEPDLDSQAQMKWIIDRVDVTAYEATLAQEKKIVDEIRNASWHKKRQDLKNSLMEYAGDKLKGLELAALPGACLPASE